MISFGEVPAGSVLPIFFDAFAAATGAPTTISGFALGDILVYKGTSMTQRSSTAGMVLLDTDGIDLDSLTGIDGFSLDLGDNTDAGFYATGSFFTVVVGPITVDGQTVTFVAATFRIRAAENTTGFQNVDVGKINNVATTPVTTVKAVQGFTTADTIATYTGNTPQTGDVYPKVDTEVATLVTGVADIQARIPAALTAGGNIKAGVQGFLDSVFTEGASGRVAAAFKQFFNIATPAATMDHGILTDTTTTLTNAPLDSSGVTTMLSRVPSGIFTGITSLAQWLGLIAGKQSGNSTARTEVRATGAGSGTFDETTDSVEALRDNLSTYAGGDTSGTTTLLSRLSAARAGYLDALNTGVALSAAGIQAIWDALTSALTTVGSIGKLLVDNINATISSRSTYAGGDTSGTTTLLSRLSATRAGYLDNLSAGAVALEASLQTLITTVGAAGAGLTAADDAVIAAIAALNNLSAANVRTAVGLASANLDTQLDALPTNTELATALGTADDAVLAAIAALNNLSQANIRSAVGLASANLDTQLDALPTNAELATALAAADDAVLAAIAALNNLSQANIRTALGMASANLDVQIAAILTTAMTESYNTDGSPATPAQALYLIMQRLTEFSISGTSLTVKKLNGSSTAAVLTLDDAADPSSSTRSI